MEVTEVTFKGNTFKIIRGSLHPQYSIDSFLIEEKDFKEQYWNPKSGDVIFDVGCSYGGYTLTACAAGAKVYAFEPEKAVYCDLVNNININKFNELCIPLNEGLHSSPQTLNMKEYAPHWPEATITSDYIMETLDSIVDVFDVEKIDWVKIDVEGVEEHVLMGGLKSLKRFLPNFIIECHVFMDSEITERVKKILLSIGNYEFEEYGRDPCTMLYAMLKK